jgi:hypothetical protein
VLAAEQVHVVVVARALLVPRVQVMARINN